jgi:hypothetical protein
MDVFLREMKEMYKYACISEYCIAFIKKNNPLVQIMKGIWINLKDDFFFPPFFLFGIYLKKKKKKKKRQ